MREILGVAGVEGTGDYSISELYYDLPENAGQAEAELLNQQQVRQNHKPVAAPSTLANPHKSQAPMRRECSKLEEQAGEIDDQLDLFQTDLDRNNLRTQRRGLEKQYKKLGCP